MYYVLFLLVCLGLAALIVRFIKYVSSFLLISLMSVFVGVLIMPLSMSTGIYISVWGICLSLFIILVSGISGIVSAFILVPLLTIWYTIKSLFSQALFLKEKTQIETFGCVFFFKIFPISFTITCFT